MKNLIKANNATYAFDLKRICQFLADMAGKEVTENEILDTFDYTGASESKLSAKSVRELKTKGNGQDSLIYDLIKIFVVQVLVYDKESDIDLDEMPLGTKLAFNTLISEGFLIEVK